MPHNTYRPDLMGSAKLDPQGSFAVRSWQSFTLTYTAGTFGIDDQGGIKIGIRGHFDGSSLQTKEPGKPGYVTAVASNGAPLEIAIESRRNIRPWNKSIFIRCLRYLNEGDMITLRLGDTRKGSPGLQLQTFCESRLAFQVLVDAFATYDFVPLSDMPHISVVPDKPANWKVIAPTLRRPGEAFRVSIKAEDKWGNPSDRIDRKITLSASQDVAGLPTELVFQPGTFSQIVEPLTLKTGGLVHFFVHDQDGALLARSNPLVIREGGFSHFWSDMHGQSGETIGINTAREYFEFARNKSFLDICGHQGNDFQITDEFWKELNALTAEFNVDGRFLAVPGYEWSGNTGTGGDHNVWYRTEGRPIFRSSRALIAERSEPETDAHRLPDLFERLAEEDAIVVAHVGGRHADVKYAFEAQLEPSVEIHSAWGTFEWLFRDAIEMGYRVGIVASSDGHKGRPGASYPGDSNFGSFGGLTCHLLPRLDRDALFDAFRRRHHYATTGARIHLNVFGQFETNCKADQFGRPSQQCMMGDVVTTADASIDLAVHVEGTAPIELVEIFDGNMLLEQRRPWDIEDVGNRVRLTVSGQRYRGRGRMVRWQGNVKLDCGSIEHFQTVNFWNHDKLPRKTGEREIDFQVVTTGGDAAIDLWLCQTAGAGTLAFSSNIGSAKFDIGALDPTGETVDCGGMDIRINAKRLPETLKESSLKETFRLSLAPGEERRIYAKVTQEDGHKAWSSPIYVTRAETRNPK